MLKDDKSRVSQRKLNALYFIGADIMKNGISDNVASRKR